MQIVNKVWGHEEIIINTSNYCGKKLVLNKGFRCSIHWHKIKDETFYVNKGKVFLEIGNVKRILLPGDSIRVLPDTKHRFTGLEDSEIIEFSTHDDSSDSYREEQSGPVDLKTLELPTVKDEKSKWTLNVDGEQEFKVYCDPPNNSKKRYTLKICPKDKTHTKKEILVIMLNPSTADENEKDKTCEALVDLCNRNGYNFITICNLFSSRGKIKELNEFIKNHTANNNLSDKKLEEQIEKFDEVLCAWGQADKIKDRNSYDNRIREVYQKLTYKKLKEFNHSTFNGNTYPKHPLYLKRDLIIKEHKAWG